MSVFDLDINERYSSPDEQDLVTKSSESIENLDGGQLWFRPFPDEIEDRWDDDIR